MRILVVGAGATGGYFGARLADAGRDVTFLVRPARAEQIRRDGLRVLSPHGDLTLQPNLLVVGEKAESFDVVMVAVKALTLLEAFEACAPAVGPTTMIVPFLNGMRHIELTQERFGPAPVLGGVCVIASTIDRHARIVQLTGGMQGLTYGELDGALTERVRALDGALEGAGFDTRLSATIVQDMWDKWVMLASAGAATCLLSGNVGEIEAVEDGAETTLRCLAEAATVAAAAGYPPRDKFMATTTALLTAKGSALATSMYRDMLIGSPVEVEHILGDLVKRGRALEIDLPLLEAATVRLRVYQKRTARVE